MLRDQRPRIRFTTSISSGRAPLSEVLRWSSNIGIVKFSERLIAARGVRDAARLRLRNADGRSVSDGVAAACSARRSSWSKQSANSLAMGYEISVTPLQLAAAYAAFANGGELVEPALVKEIIAPDGAVRFEHKRRVVRRVMTRSTSRTRCGTCCSTSSMRARRCRRRSTTIMLAGKTGTPRGTVQRALRRGTIQSELRRHVSRRQPAVRHRREADCAAEARSTRQRPRRQ